MCDEDSTYTERARSWLKEHEPTADQIQDAYFKMQTKIAKSADLAGGDTDECLELLIAAYGKAGGSVDELLSAVDAEKAAQQIPGAVAGTAELDCGTLYPVHEGPAVELPPDEKLAVFKRLKQQLEGKTKAA